MIINLEFDSQAQAAPASFRAAIEEAAAILQSTFTDNATINISVGYGELQGVSLGDQTSAEGGPDSGLSVSYPSVYTSLTQNASAGDTTFAGLPNTTSIQGQPQVAVWNAEAKVLGYLSPTDTALDGSVAFGTDIPTNLLVGVALHELTHAMGRVPNGPEPDIFDLFRFTAPGDRLFSSANTAPAAYFSLDGGNTDLANYGQQSDPSDFLNAPDSTLTPLDAFDEYYSSSMLQTLTPVDLQQMDALGFHINPDQLFGASVFSATAPGGEIYAFYEGLLGRAPDALGFEAWTANLEAGMSLQQIAQDFLASSEFTADFGSYTSTSDQTFVEDLYQTALHRSADAGGLQYWENQLQSGALSRADVAVDIALSAEAQGDLQSAFTSGVFVPNASDAQIARLYYGLLDRAPDMGGLEYWESAALNGASLTTIAQDFFNSPEYASGHAGQSSTQFINALYEDALGRAPDPAGAQFWENQLASGVPQVAVALGIVESAEAQQHLASNIETGFKLA